MAVLSGATVHACWKAGQYFLVMEEFEDIYKSVLQPLIVEPVVEVSKRLRLEAEVALGLSEEEV